LLYSHTGRGPAGGGRTPTAAGRGGGRGPLPAAVALPAAANIVNIHASPAGSAPHQQQQQQRGSTFSFFTAANGEQLQDEYDPSRPNDFEELLKQRKKKQREAEEEAERLARMREIQQVRLCWAAAGRVLLPASSSMRWAVAVG
jgi:splicing factor 45